MNIWAITRDGNIECQEGLDESGCETQIWFLSVILFGTGFLLWFVSFLPSVGSVSVEVEDLVQVPEHYVLRQERSFCIAVLTETNDIDEIKKIFRREIQTLQGNENEALCYFKVMSKS